MVFRGVINKLKLDLPGSAARNSCYVDAGVADAKGAVAVLESQGKPREPQATVFWALLPCGCLRCFALGLILAHDTFTIPSGHVRLVRLESRAEPSCKFESQVLASSFVLSRNHSGPGPRLRLGKQRGPPGNNTGACAKALARLGRQTSNPMRRSEFLLRLPPRPRIATFPLLPVPCAWPSPARHRPPWISTMPSGSWPRLRI